MSEVASPSPLPATPLVETIIEVKIIGTTKHLSARTHSAPTKPTIWTVPTEASSD